MKYRGIYWTALTPMIRRSLRKRYGQERADTALRNGKREYRNLLSRADDLGPGNPLAMNAYFAYVFAAVWIGSGKEIPPEELGSVMKDVLTSPLIKFYFGMTDMNRDDKKWYREMKKYEAWYRKHSQEYPVNWEVHFDETRHRDGTYYYFTRCPICEFCRREGIGELMPSLCATDRVMFRLQHGVLHREHTIADGGAVCDYWVVGDRTSDPQ